MAVDTSVNRLITPFFDLIHTAEMFSNSGTLTANQSIKFLKSNPVGVAQTIELDNLGLPIHWSQFFVTGYSWSWSEENESFVPFPPVADVHLFHYFLDLAGARIPNPNGFDFLDDFFNWSYALVTSNLSPDTPAIGFRGGKYEAVSVILPSGDSLEIGGIEVELFVDEDVFNDTPSSNLVLTYNFSANQIFFIDREGQQP